MRLSSPIYKLKRQAKILARGKGIRLYEALNQIANQEGFKDWGHLASSYRKTTPAKDIINRMRSGSLVLIGARPGHGKTLLGLELTALAEHLNRTGCFFSLEENEADVWNRFKRLGYEPKKSSRPIVVDTSDEICADHIVECLSKRADDALVVVDYLQLLDQKRSNPPLEHQIRLLKKFAAERGTIFVMISQIDRAFERREGDFPSIDDIRMPNPVDLSLLTRDVSCMTGISNWSWRHRLGHPYFRGHS